MAIFDDIAARYRTTSLVQASAGEQLIGLLDISGSMDLLDVGCGTGNLTAALAGRTSGNVTGIDPSEAMIREASTAFPDPRISFRVMDDTGMDDEQAFDVIYCNSAFQWFRNPARFLGKARKALRPGGRIGVQAPATRQYCPVFIEAIGRCCADPSIRQVFSGFRPPWFFLESAEAYGDLFEAAGFRVLFCTIEESGSFRTPREVFDVFCSGATAGYLDPSCYDCPWPEGFENAFLDGMRRSFETMAAADGKLDLMFRRIFLVGDR
ncbi:MAG: class I SAM-dependent methyltransferase [Chlorobiaceae bacterium]|nr:class I SAM-dependent methyltransferase [Chlorobiaceae bacterium]NTW74741.1 class I SAM-dependent methyltransferase [Chlorobiaceae bacterium]